jgi:quinoprotein glucose dehydrogenase
MLRVLASRSVHLVVLPLALSGAPDQAAAVEPVVQPASAEGERAIARFTIPAGLRVELFAAEPLLANPVAFSIDVRGRIYVAETYRLGHGVTDIRDRMDWLETDLASRTVEDREAMYRKYLGARAEVLTEVSERVRLVEDTDGDGRADRATTFATGFHELAAGLGAGVLAHRGEVYYACIPDLWLLRDADGDGRAEVQRSLQRGYGIRLGYGGHDLHGLRMGPDGKLYFTIGDRGAHVTAADGRSVFLPEGGAVLRCDPDGSDLEVVATGLRNPQELAFDEFGHLFTVDNNSDAGDLARLVYLVEGGDSGWRVGYQFIDSPLSRSPWHTEKLWRTAPENTAAYLLPPLGHISDGPSGLAYDPGATLLPARYRRHFFLADFRGSGASGVRAFAVEPRGASFEMIDPRVLIWGPEATDVDFGPDGALYIADWVEGWGPTGKGRLYRVFDPARRGDPTALEVRALLAEGMDRRPIEGLAQLLDHPDMRIRQEAQFALVEKGREAVERLWQVARRGADRLARLHAIWGLAQLSRRGLGPAPVLELGTDADAEVRAQAARVAGWARGSPPRVGDPVPLRPEEVYEDRSRGTAPILDRLTALLDDDSPRVRFFAALSLGALGGAKTPEPILRMLRRAGDRDPYLRHAGVMALSRLDESSLLPAARDSSAAVRLGVLLALRRRGSPAVARFLEDADPRLVLEAARAIHDVPIARALPRLAALAVEPGQPEALLVRVLNANFRLGRAEDAARLARLAARPDAPQPIRVEALDALGDWCRPPGRDRVLSLWRPLPQRPAGPAREAAGRVVVGLLRDAPEAVQRAAARLAGRLELIEAAATLAALAGDPARAARARIEALRALGKLDADRQADAVDRAVTDPEAMVRAEGLRLLARLRPSEAIAPLERALEAGSTAERQGAFAALGALEGPAADAILSRWLDQLAAGRVAPEVQLDLIEAAARRPARAVRDQLARVEAGQPKDDPMARARVALSGGDADRGGRIFREKAEVQCLRCHKLGGAGGGVGPELTGIGARTDRASILESIVAPNRQIAQGFETVVVATTDGRIHTGILKREDEAQVHLMTADGQLAIIPKDRIEDRKRGDSAMPPGLAQKLSLRELRDLVEFLAGSK